MTYYLFKHGKWEQCTRQQFERAEPGTSRKSKKGKCAQRTHRPRQPRPRGPW